MFGAVFYIYHEKGCRNRKTGLLHTILIGSYGNNCSVCFSLISKMIRFFYVSTFYLLATGTSFLLLKCSVFIVPSSAGYVTVQARFLRRSASVLFLSQKSKALFCLSYSEKDQSFTLGSPSSETFTRGINCFVEINCKSVANFFVFVYALCLVVHLWTILYISART